MPKKQKKTLNKKTKLKSSVSVKKILIIVKKQQHEEHH